MSWLRSMRPRPSPADALGEAAYSAALGRGAAMDENEVADYALGEFRRLLDRPMS